MKFAPFLLVPMLLLAAVSSRAQTQTPIGQGSIKQKRKFLSQSEDQKANWLFMLETKTQWLLVIQSNSSSSNSTKNALGDSNSSAGIATDGISNTAANGTNAMGGRITNPVVKKEDNTIVFDNNKNTIVFEGNTNDLPLLPPLTNPGKSPSSPDT